MRKGIAMLYRKWTREKKCTRCCMFHYTRRK